MSSSTQGVLDVAGVLDGARIVVLGGTGFLGKLFWAMLVERYPDVGEIVIVVRAKSEGTPEARFWNEIAPSDSLAPLRRAHGEGFEAFLRTKVTPIAGDMGRPLCGIDPERIADLRGSVAAVVNVAGIVDFNPPLDEALEANAFGAQNLIDLARALGNVPILHTSTCYVAGTRRGPILEEDPRGRPFPRYEELGSHVWNPDTEIAECLDLVQEARHRAEDAFRQSEFAERAKRTLIKRGEPTRGAVYAAELARVKRKFVRDRLVSAGLDRATHWGWPNIYLYTKAIGEQVIAQSGLRFAIARPACCESCVAFPTPAFNEGENTSAPLIYLMMKGQLTIVAQHVPLDLIPSDYVVAGMILALAELVEGTAASVYQFGASDVNPCTAQRFGELVGLYKRQAYRRKGASALFAALQSRFEPSFVDGERFELVGSPAISSVAKGLASFVRRAAPSLSTVADALDEVSSKQAKIAEVQKLFEPFSAQVNGPFDCSNTRAAYGRLSDEDKEKLPWRPESIDWADWMMNVHMPAMEERIIPVIDRRLKKERGVAPHETLLSLLDEMAERHGDAVALQRLTDEGLTRTSYEALRAGAEAVAGRLVALGVVRGDRVVLSGRNDPAWAMGYFGIVRAGATVVPMDPALDSEAWRNVLTESGARLVVGDAHVRHGTGLQRSLAADGLGWVDLAWAVETEDAPKAASVVVEASDVASILFTSGTTGRPKGVRLSHANFTSLVAALAPIFPLSEGDAVLSVLPLHHTFEFTCGLLLPLSRGARVVFVGEVRAERIAQGLRASRATAMVGVPALWQSLERRILQEVDARGPAARATFDTALEVNRWFADHVGVDLGRILFGAVHAQMGGQVRWLVSGGAALPRETQERFAGLGLPLTQGYGLTEASPVLTVSTPGAGNEVGVGRPVNGVQIRIAEPDANGVGEIVARGPNVMLGYTDEEATREAIDPTGWLRTGDLGTVDRKGRLQIVGRAKEVVISPTGENVYPDDVEARLRHVTEVSELSVVGVQVAGGERLACLAVPASLPSGADPAEMALQALRRAIDLLPPGQRPSIVKVRHGALPRTAMGKVKRSEVAAILEELLARPHGSDAPVDGRSNEVRMAVAAVRGSRVDEIRGRMGLQGELGFDSMMLVELHEQLERRLGPVDAQRLAGCTTVGDVEGLFSPGPSERDSRLTTSVDEGADSEPTLLLPTPIRKVGKAFVGRLQDAFYGVAMKPRVFGRAYIPYNRSVIVVANHSSHLDMGLVRHALGRYGHGIVSLAAQDYFFSDPWRRTFFENLTNLHALDRRASLRQAIRQAAAVLEQGKTVLVFPEGTRSATGEVGEFKSMVGHLALSHRIDILPVYLAGTHEAMGKGAMVPIRRDISARIGRPLAAHELARLTEGLAPARAAKEVARIAREAVVALRDGNILDLAGLERGGEIRPGKEHPLVQLFAELESKFRVGEVSKPLSYYVTLGSDDLAKWTVRVDALACDVRPGRPDGGQADCVLKTSPEVFTKIVREAYVPSAADFLAGVIKSNDVSLLLTFQRVFQLDQAS